MEKIFLTSTAQRRGRVIGNWSLELRIKEKDLLRRQWQNY